MVYILGLQIQLRRFPSFSKELTLSLNYHEMVVGATVHTSRLRLQLQSNGRLKFPEYPKSKNSIAALLNILFKQTPTTFQELSN